MRNKIDDEVYAEIERLIKEYCEKNNVTLLDFLVSFQEAQKKKRED